MPESWGRQGALQRIPLDTKKKWTGENGDGFQDSDEMKKEWKIEAAIEEVGTGRTQWTLLVICGLTFCSDAAEVTFISLITETLRFKWDLRDSDIMLIQSAVFMGMIVGAPLWGCIADYLGRRTAFLLSSAVICIFGFATALSFNFLSLIIFRCTVGIGVAGLPVGFDILAEALPVQGRGKFLLYIEYFWTLGSIYINICAWVTLTQTEWRLFTALAAVPTLISSIAGYLCLPESPRWLMEQNREEEALVIVNNWAKSNHKNVRFESLEKSSTEQHLNFMDLFKNRKLRYTTFFMSIIWFGFGIAYYSILLLLPRIFEEEREKGSKKGTTFDFADLATTAGFEILGVMLGIVMIEKPGRVCTQFVFYTIGAVSAFLLSFRTLSKLILTAIASVGRLAEMAACCATYVHTPELFPTSLRGQAHAGLNLVSKVGAAVAPFILSKNFTQIQAGSIVASVSLLAGFSALFLRETAGMDLSEIDDELSDNSSSTCDSEESDS